MTHMSVRIKLTAAIYPPILLGRISTTRLTRSLEQYGIQEPNILNTFDRLQGDGHAYPSLCCRAD